MSQKRILLKEAIADAKTVKAMAIANAKAALEETFTPQLTSMLSAKIQEMDEEEEELDESGFGEMNADPEEGFSEMGEKALDEEDELDLEELLAELNESEDDEVEDEEIEDEEDESTPLDLENMTDEDLVSMIENVVKDMVGSGELELDLEDENEEEEEMEDEDVNLDELLAEIEGLDDEDDDLMNEEEEDLDEIFGFGKAGSGGSKFIKDFISANKSAIDQVVATDDKTSKNAAAKELITKFYNQNVRKMDSGALRSDVSVLRTALGLEALGGASKGSVSTAENIQSELDEAYATIESLRGSLNEVNLLNAKLLYTNKIFKSKNLTESQKVKVLTTFDKATTVKETKLVFDTLNESLKVKSNLMEGRPGSASQVTGIPKTKQPIVESDEMVKRFQTLAGII
jgi:hypothetical protein